MDSRGGHFRLEQQTGQSRRFGKHRSGIDTFGQRIIREPGAV